ncbi:HET-E1 [Symbiodinium sp. CCMP2592]|nr:HET-E1 [Symbiodinium sp. CCMP2592]
MSCSYKRPHASPSKLRRDFARCWAHKKRLGSQEHRCGLRDALDSVLSHRSSCFTQYWCQWIGSEGGLTQQGRQCELFPLPPATTWTPGVKHLPCTIETALTFLNMCIASLNLLAGDMHSGCAMQGCRSSPTAAQQQAIDHVAHRCNRFLVELHSGTSETESWERAFRSFESPSGVKYPKLQAEAVDLPDRAGTCDPMTLLPAELARNVCDPGAIFQTAEQGHASAVVPTGKERGEYLKLVHRQLQCGKLVLLTRVRQVGDVFCVPKSDPSKQREIWNGTAVSGMAVKPPRPMLLANPSCFVDLLFREGESIYMSKRDVHTCFDVLQAPSGLQEWFGRPPITLAELSQVSGAEVDELRKYLPTNLHDAVQPKQLVYPASAVWPMGFSWSSCVAQACTVACCQEAGVAAANFMTMEQAVPTGPEVCGVATDDTFFIHKDKAVGAQRLCRLDAALAGHGMPKNKSKDVTLETEMTALGCKLTVQPPAVEPDSGKLTLAFKALLDVLAQRTATPVGLSRLLGVEQWFCLLNRPMFSIFDKVYDFVRKEPQACSFLLPDAVWTELAVAALLMPLLGADLSRGFLPQLIACDAAPQFGFGVSFFRCSSKLTEKVGSLAERRGDYIKFFPEPGVLEARGLLLAVKWALRSKRNFNRRIVVLVDAKAVLGAATKGRTSAPVIRGVLRKLAALLLSTNSLLRLVYVPTEHNPADAPSRGRRRRPNPTRATGF